MKISGKERTIVKNEEESKKILLNKRKYNRYIINGFSIKDISTTERVIGNVVEISRGGMKIWKTTLEEIIDSKLIIPIINKQIEVDIVWQDKKYIGLKFSDERVAVKLINQLMRNLARKIKEPDTRSKRIISDSEISKVTKSDLFSSLIIYMAELENPDVKIAELKMCVEEISRICTETYEREKREAEKAAEVEAPAAAAPDGPKEEKKPEGTAEVKEQEPAGPPDLRDVLNSAASRGYSSEGSEITDIDFAIQRLGLDSVKKISSDFLTKKLSELEIPLSNFKDYRAYNILKTVTFKRLTPFFGFKDEREEANQLLSLETKGVEILMDLGKENSEDLKDYYISPSRIYSEISRMYERKYFGKDIVQINDFYFRTKLEKFESIYDGYVLAHLMHDLCYTPGRKMKLNLSKRKLLLSFLVYLTFVATKFIISRERESGVYLANILKKTGMDESKIMNFLNKCIGESNNVLKNLGLSGNLRTVQAPFSSFKIESYLPKNIHYDYLLKSFNDFSILKSARRMAVRYEDEAYTHFILNKFMTIDTFGFNSKVCSVIPCKNISDNELYVGDFSFFDLIILKDVDKLSSSHKNDFLKLWNSFEGKIIATFSSYSFLDFDNEDLYRLLKDHIVDFPSYFSNEKIYEKMIDHTAGHLKPYMGEKEIDRKNYLGDFFSMNYIKMQELVGSFVNS
jgi:hypothetical protein